MMAERRRQIFQHVKNSAPQIQFQLGLPGERFLTETVEQAASVGSSESRRAKQRDEEPEVFERTKGIAVGQSEFEVRVIGRLLAVKPPEISVGENRPVEEPHAGLVL